MTIVLKNKYMLSEWYIRDSVLKKNLIPDTRVAVLADLTGSVTSMAPCFDSTLTLVATDQTVSVFDVFRGYKLASFEFSERLVATGWSSDFKAAISITSNSVFRMNLESGQTSELEQLKRFETAIRCGAVNKGTCVVVDSQGVVWRKRSSNDVWSRVSIPFEVTTVFATDDILVLGSSDGIGLLVSRESGDSLVSADQSYELAEVSYVNGSVVGRAKDAVVVWKVEGEGKELMQQTVLKDVITKTTYQAIFAFEFNSRKLLAVSFKEQSGRAILELMDLETLMTVRKWDVSRMGSVCGLFGFQKGFFSVLQDGPVLVWTVPKQEKADNWMTCIPNLESCFTNIPYEEAENEFDFNLRRNPCVVSRYKVSDKPFDFRPRGTDDLNPPRFEGVNRDMHMTPSVDDESSDGREAHTVKYGFCDFQVLQKRWTALEEPLVVRDAGAGDNFEDETETVFF